MDGHDENRREAIRARREPRRGPSKCGTLRQQLAAIQRYLETARAGRDEQAWQRALLDSRRE